MHNAEAKYVIVSLLQRLEECTGGSGGQGGGGGGAGGGERTGKHAFLSILASFFPRGKRLMEMYISCQGIFT